MKRMIGVANAKPMIASIAATMIDISSVWPGHVANAGFIPFAAELGDQHRAGDRQSAAQRNTKEGDGKTERYRGHGLGA